MVNPTYTLFELWFRFGFLVLSFVAIFLLTYRLHNTSWRKWTSEQRYVQRSPLTRWFSHSLTRSLV